MPVFVYRAADRRGQTIDGVMEAPDARSVVERLQRDSYFPIRVSPHADRPSWLSLGGSGRISQSDVLAFTQQLATLFEATLPLDRALSILEELAANGRVKAIVTDLLASVRGGASLSEALAKHHPRPFGASSSRIASARSSGRVASKSVASCWVNARMSPWLIRPEPPRDSQPRRSACSETRIGK